MNTSGVGAAAEQAAARYLKQHGYQCRTRNYRWYHGEIDLVVSDGRSCVFVEVRLRTNVHCGTAADSLTRLKQQRLLKTAEHYICTQEPVEQYFRFDFIALEWNAPHYRVIDWIQNAFETDTLI